MFLGAPLSLLSGVLAEKFGRETVLMYRDPYVCFWHSVSASYMNSMVCRLCNAMLMAGVNRGDRIMVLSENMPEYIYVSLAAYKAGMVVVPVFSGTSRERLETIAKITESRLLFAGESEQYAMAATLYGACPALKRVIVFDSEVSLRKGDMTSRHMNGFLKNVSAHIAQPMPQPRNDEAADIIFTSGTTGEPKGVVITHGMYSAAFKANAEKIKVGEGWKVLEYLPYNHVFERAWSLFCLQSGAVLVVNQRPSHLQRALREIRPEAMCCVPHFWEKLRQTVYTQIASQPRAIAEVWERCLDVGRRRNVDFAGKGKPVPEDLEREYRMCNKTALSMMRREAGLENARVMPTAGAVVAKEIEEFARACSLPMLVGYGLTETTATVSCDDFLQTVTPGSVGRTISGISLKFGENNEILLRGDTVAHEYFRNPEASKETFRDGWLHTGDAGCMENGELFITGRIKQLMKTSTGKYVAPEQIEAAVNADPAVAQTVVIAEGRKFVGALILPAKTLTGADVAPTDVRRRIREVVEKRQENLPPFCRIKRFMIITEPLTTDNRCLTPTLKIRRDAVARKFSEEIETIYDNKKYRKYDNL